MLLPVRSRAPSRHTACRQTPASRSLAINRSTSICASHNRSSPTYAGQVCGSRHDELQRVAPASRRGRPSPPPRHHHPPR
eukprot:2209669-Prymnesium_polylepis.1